MPMACPTSAVAARYRSHNLERDLPAASPMARAAAPRLRGIRRSPLHKRVDDPDCPSVPALAPSRPRGARCPRRRGPSPHSRIRDPVRQTFNSTRIISAIFGATATCTAAVPPSGQLDRLLRIDLPGGAGIGPRPAPWPPPATRRQPPDGGMRRACIISSAGIPGRRTSCPAIMARPLSASARGGSGRHRHRQRQPHLVRPRRRSRRRSE